MVYIFRVQIFAFWFLLVSNFFFPATIMKNLYQKRLLQRHCSLLIVFFGFRSTRRTTSANTTTRTAFTISWIYIFLMTTTKTYLLTDERRTVIITLPLVHYRCHLECSLDRCRNPTFFKRIPPKFCNLQINKRFH